MDDKCCLCKNPAGDRPVLYNNGQTTICSECRRWIAASYIRDELSAFGLDKLGKLIAGMFSS